MNSYPEYLSGIKISPYGIYGLLTRKTTLTID